MNNTVLIRKALPDEHGILTELAVRSEAHWGYDSDYMNTFRTEYGVTEEYIQDNPVFVLEKDGRPVGFYGFLLSESSLEYLLSTPNASGRGSAGCCGSMRIPKEKPLG